MGQVIDIPAKTSRGVGKNYKWFITFDRTARVYRWRVEFTMTSVLHGEAKTDAAARAEVDRHIRNVRK